MRRALLLLAAVSLGCSSPPPPSPAAEISCVAEGQVLHQRCTVRLSDRRTGNAIEGATVTLGADMPSMPLAHHVRPAAATPGSEPGTYHGVLELEMTGRWVIAVRIAGPVEDQVTHPIDVATR